MQHSVASGRSLEQVLAGEILGGDLAEMVVERGDVIHRFPADIALAEQLRRHEFRRHVIECAVFGRLVQEGVAELCLVSDYIRGEKAGRKLPQMPLRCRHVKDAISAVAAGEQILAREDRRRHLEKMAGLGGVVQGRVTQLVLQEQILRRQNLSRQFAKPAISRRRVQRGVPGGVRRGDVLHTQLVCRDLKEGPLANRGMQVRFFHASKLMRDRTIRRGLTQTKLPVNWICQDPIIRHDDRHG